MPRLAHVGPAVLIMVCGVAAAQEQREPAAPAPGAVAATPANLATFVDQLGSPSARERAAAESTLVNATEIRFRDLEPFLARAGMSPEQRWRLEQVGYVKFCSEPRAAMGINAANPLVGDIVLGGVVQNFPAAQLLRAGDRIVEVEGRRVANFQELRPIIISRDPGDEMNLVVVRDGQRIQLRVKLGSFDNLRNAMGMEPDTLRLAWEARIGKRPEDGPLITSGLAPEAWLAHDDWTLDEDPRITRGPQVDRRQSPGIMTGAGEPRNGITADTGQAAAQVNAVLESLMRQVEEISTRLRDPNLDDATRSALLIRQRDLILRLQRIQAAGMR